MSCGCKIVLDPDPSGVIFSPDDCSTGNLRIVHCPRHMEWNVVKLESEIKVWCAQAMNAMRGAADLKRLIMAANRALEDGDDDSMKLLLEAVREAEKWS